MFDALKIWRRFRRTPNETVSSSGEPVVRFKCGIVDQRQNRAIDVTPLVHHNEFQIQQFPNETAYVVIAPSANHIEVLKDLAAALSEPLFMRHLLVEACGEHEAGRYDLPLQPGDDHSCDHPS